MSLSIPYENLNDAQMRLQNTVVLYDGEPVYIQEIGQVGPGDPKEDIFRVYAYPLPYKPAGVLPKAFKIRHAGMEQWHIAIDNEGNPVRVKPPRPPAPEPKPEDDGQAGFRKFISSKKFDLAPFPMGFLNDEGKVFYCHRRPRRQQRQGLSGETFIGEAVDSGEPPLQFGEVVGSSEFLDCIKGNYPRYDLAYQMVKGDGLNAVAFARNFALIRDKDMEELIYLYHKKEKVGFIVNGLVSLSKKGNCLRESLREEGVQC
jgi:hypothetical protein